jgi:DNA-binding NtrC family response regulator
MRVELGGNGLEKIDGAELGSAGRPDALRDLSRRVLIVEDDPPLAENLCEIVELSGYDAFSVPSGEAALLEIVRDPIDFIVTDHRLPGMSGAALLFAVRSLGRKIPAVITTAWISDDAAETASGSGLTDVMTKPIDIEALIAVLHRALGPATPRPR